MGRISGTILGHRQMQEALFMLSRPMVIAKLPNVGSAKCMHFLGILRHWSLDLARIYPKRSRRRQNLLFTVWKHIQVLGPSSVMSVRPPVIGWKDV